MRAAYKEERQYSQKYDVSAALLDLGVSTVSSSLHVAAFLTLSLRIS
jgi:hypothetical protein